jgi:hypothetical protein
VNAWLNHSFENISSLYNMLFILSGCGRYLKNINRNTNFETQSTTTDSRSFDTQSMISEKSTVKTESVINEDTQTIKEENDDSENEDYDYEYEDFENTFIQDYLPKFQGVCETSNALAEALLLDWIVKSILIEVNILLQID